MSTPPNDNPYAAPQPPAAPAYGTPPAYSPPAAPAPGAYGQPPQYPVAPQYGGAPAYGYATQRTNTLAIISMIASILGFIWVLPFIGSLAGVIMGHISLKQIAQTGEGGRGMALAGVIVGWIGLAFVVLGVILIFAVFIPIAATTSYYS